MESILPLHLPLLLQNQQEAILRYLRHGLVFETQGDRMMQMVIVWARCKNQPRSILCSRLQITNQKLG